MITVGMISDSQMKYLHIQYFCYIYKENIVAKFQLLVYFWKRSEVESPKIHVYLYVKSAYYQTHIS